MHRVVELLCGRNDMFVFFHVVETCLNISILFTISGPWSNLEKGECIKVTNRSNYRDMILVGDTRGRIRLYKNPCSKERVSLTIY